MILSISSFRSAPHIGVGKISSRNISQRRILKSEAMTPSPFYTLWDPRRVNGVRIVQCHSSVFGCGETCLNETPMPLLIWVEVDPSVVMIGSASVPTMPLFIPVVIWIDLEIVPSLINRSFILKEVGSCFIFFVVRKPEISNESFISEQPGRT